MPGLASTCPRCKTQIALDIVGYTKAKFDRPVVMLMCRNCEMPAMAMIATNHIHNIDQAIVNQSNITINRFVAGITEFLPENSKPEAPSHTPPEAARVYAQARSAHQRRELDGAAMLYRKTLEVALKVYDPTVTGMLHARITALTNKQALPPALTDWAHLVKQVGNEGAHDLPEPTDEDVDDLFLFTESLLEYLFTMPTKLAERKAQHHGKKDGS